MGGQEISPEQIAQLCMGNPYIYNEKEWPAIK
jgi:hypothetical protein